MGIRSLQRQRHGVQKQLSEAQQKEFGELKVGVCRSTDIILALQKQPSFPSLTISPEAHLHRKETEGNSSEKSSVTTVRKKLEKRSDAICIAANRQKEFRARIKAPSWLMFINTLDIYYYKAAPGWKFSMTAYRVVGCDSELYSCIDNGNVIGLQKLFGQKKASPFDKIEFRWNRASFTLLEVSEL